jgi:hypothetical protein
MAEKADSFCSFHMIASMSLRLYREISLISLSKTYKTFSNIMKKILTHFSQKFMDFTQLKAKTSVYHMI